MATDPFVQNNPIVNAMEQQRGRREQVRENATRLAKSYGRWQTTGIGATLVPDVFDFNCTFIEEPSFTSGWSLVEDGPDIDTTDIPLVDAGVYRWQQDSRGYYTGAWVVLNVIATSVEYVIQHYLAFEAVAIKDLRDVTYLLDT